MKNKKSLFHERFSSLRGNMTQAEFAKFIGISRPTVGFYENGERLPDAIVLKQISEKCNVSADWLIGLSDVKTTDITIKSICKYTGLSEKSAMILSSIPKKSSLVKTINVIIENYEWITGDNHEKQQ